MSKFISNLRDTFIAGLIFLLPIIIIFVLVTKVYQALSGISVKIAGMFGLKSFLGVSGGTIITSIVVILFCILCGYLMRVSFFKVLNSWLDNKLATHIPGYKVYREMAMGKLEKKEEVIPYKKAAWVEVNEMLQPGLVVEYHENGKVVVFVPEAGDSKRGEIYLLTRDKIKEIADDNLKSFLAAVDARGFGLSRQAMAI